MTTEAGRAPCGARLAWDEIAVCGTHGIKCIEAEARAALLAELEAGVRELADGFGDVSAAAVLDLIRKAKP